MKNRVNHGYSKTKVYDTWCRIKNRCQNKKEKCYYRYGGRGIKICERWNNSFLDFLKDMGEPLPHQSIDRIDNNGNYEPSNCRWADNKTQSRNRRDTIHLTIDNETKPLREWAEISGISPVTIFQRLYTLKWGNIKDAVFKKSKRDL